jgi:hypothetical protein
VTRYNTYNRGSSTWKLKAAAGALVLAGGVAGGVALTHHSTAVHDTAFQFGFGQHGYGPMLDSAMNGLAFPGASGFTRHRSLEELGGFHGFGGQFNFWSHHSFSHLAFERGQIVFISHHFLVVRSLDGRLTVWQLFGNTMVEDVAPTGTTGTATPPVTPPATPTPTITPPVSATPTVRPTTTPTVAPTTPVTGMPMLTSTTATQAVTGGVPVASMVGSTTAAQQPGTTTISVTTGGTTITITITSTTSVARTATVTTPTTTSTVPTTSLAWHNGLVPGDVVFVSGHVRGHRHLAELVLVESAATTTPTASPTVSALPTTTPPHTVTPTTTVTPTITPTLTPTTTPTVTPTAPVSTTPAPTPTTSTPAAAG